MGSGELEFKYHNPEDGLRYMLNFDYQPGEDAPMFKEYLNRVLPNQCKQLPLAEFIGYAFSDLKLEKCLVLYGTGANGKSVFFDLVIALLGNENISNYSLQSLTDGSGYSRANLSGKLINYASELSPKMNTSFFKMLVSGEPIEARQVYQRAFLLHQIPKLIFNTNELPFDIEQNDGFYRRFMLIHFDQTISEQEMDPELARKIIATELPGVFNWVLEGLQRISTDKQFSPCDAVAKALVEFREDHDPIRLFLSEIQAEPRHPEMSKMPLKMLYTRYVDYSKEFGYRSCALQAFSKRIQAMGYTVERKSSHGRDIGIYIPVSFSSKTN
jgi:putative DNA primase/helicase